MDRKVKKDGSKRWLLWLLLVLILAGVFIWLIVRNNGTSLNIQDLSISSSSKNSISLDVKAEGNDLSYYYSLDGINYTKVDGPSFTISGLSENTTYTVYVKVINAVGIEKVEKKEIKTASDSSEVSLTLERTELTVAPEGEKVSIAISGKGYGKLSCQTSDQLVAKCEVKDLSLIVVPGIKAGKTTITVTEDSYNVSAKLKVTSEDLSVPSTDGGEQGGYTPTPQPTPTPEPTPEPVYYTVSFTTNGFGTVSKTSVSVLEGTAISTASATAKVGDNEITATPNDNTAEYTYGFVNWSHNCGAALTADCTVQAEFSRNKNSYTISFNNGEHGTKPEDQTLEYGSKVTKPIINDDNYTLVGWYKESTLTNEWDFELDTITSEITLYAKWIPALNVITGQQLILPYDDAYTYTIADESVATLISARDDGRNTAYGGSDQTIVTATTTLPKYFDGNTNLYPYLTLTSPSTTNISGSSGENWKTGTLTTYNRMVTSLVPVKEGDLILATCMNKNGTVADGGNGAATYGATTNAGNVLFGNSTKITAQYTPSTNWEADFKTTYENPLGGYYGGKTVPAGATMTAAVYWTADDQNVFYIKTAKFGITGKAEGTTTLTKTSKTNPGDVTIYNVSVDKDNHIIVSRAD